MLAWMVMLLSTSTALAGGYEPYAGIARGRAGLEPLAFAARNLDAPRIACSVGLAHWHAEELGSAAPGEAVEAVLWHDPATGAVHRLNAQEDRMPVETLWCGLVGHAWATRSAIGLDRVAGSGPPALTVECRAVAERLDCVPAAHR